MHAATRMNQLIQDLLDVALSEAGQLRVSPERVSAPVLVRDVLEMQASVADAAGVTLRFDVVEGAGDVWGDRGRLLQVFENLIGNAVKFTKAGGEITVGAERKGEDVSFSVSDTGSGMAPDAAEHVFDRFWQAPTKEKRLGAGLGLAIVKGIVEAHGGRISLETALGRGTTFTFTIPTARPQPPPGPPRHPREPERRRRERPTRTTH